MSASKLVTVDNAVDTYADKAAPNRRRHRGALLAVQSGGSGADAYLFFGFPAPAGARILSAKLRLYTSGSWGGAAPTLTASRLTSKFVASKLTANDNLPTSTASGAVAVSHASTGDGDLWEWNVATMMQLVADGAAWYGFKITSNSATRRLFRSAQADELRPELVVEWADAPDQPTTLSPSEQVVSVAKPVVEMDYTDPTAGTLTSAQVLVSTVEAMTAPFDSGEVAVPAGVKARVDLSATAYAGLANGSTAWWQGRVKDGSEEWSDYSDPTSFTRYSKGSVVIDSPSAGSPTLTDFTPTTLFTFTPPASPGGVVQEKYRVTVARVDDGTLVYDSEEVAGTASSHVVESDAGKAVLRLGVDYLLRVQVWDSLDRVSTAEDPAYVEATREFTLATGATAAPGALTVTAVDAPPAYEVAFTRASAPDSFVALVDGEPVEVDLDPAELFDAGTTYRYRFPVVRGNAEVTLGMAAVENGVMSAVTTSTESRRIGGAWLVDKLDPTRFLFVAKTGGSTIELGEDGETMVPLGAEAGVRVTRGLRGYEGTITGVLLAQYGRTLQEWVDEALAMRGRPGRDYVLLIGSEAFEVFIADLKVRPTGDSAPTMRPISFGFGQTDAQRVAVTL